MRRSISGLEALGLGLDVATGAHPSVDMGRSVVSPVMEGVHTRIDDAHHSAGLATRIDR